MVKYSIVNVKDMIEDALVIEEDGNTVIHLNLIGSVLLLLARELNLSQRKFAVELGFEFPDLPTYSISRISEVKLLAHGSLDNLEIVKLLPNFSERNTERKATGRGSNIETEFNGEKKSLKKQDRGSSKTKEKEPSKIGKKESSKNGDKEYFKKEDKMSSQNEIKKRHTNYSFTKNNDDESGTAFVSDESETSNDSFDSRLLTDSASKSDKKKLNKKSQTRFNLTTNSSSTANDESDSINYSKESSVHTTSTESSKGGSQTYANKNKEVRERLLIVQEGKQNTLNEKYLKPKSLASKEQFINLCHEVAELLPKFSPIDIPDQEKVLMNSFYKRTTLTNPMAVLQLSARLEKIEKSIEDMQNVIEEIFKQNTVSCKSTAVATELPPVIEDTNVKTKSIGKLNGGKHRGIEEIHNGNILNKTIQQETENTSSEIETLAEEYVDVSVDIKPFGKQRSTTSYKTIKSEASETALKFTVPYQLDELNQDQEAISLFKNLISDRSVTAHQELVTQNELQSAILQFRNDALTSLNNVGAKPVATLEKMCAVFRSHRKLLEDSSDVEMGIRTVDIELAVWKYSDKINKMDANFSGMMTSLKDELNKMLHELETGITNMTKNLADVNDDNEEMETLEAKFIALHMDLNRMMMMQAKLEADEEVFIKKGILLSLNIDELKIVKSDREEIEFLIKSKAGLKAFNTFVSREIFEGIYRRLADCICSAYEKFDKHECVWDRMINELQIKFALKAKKHQVQAVHEDIDNNVRKLREKLVFIAECLGDTSKSENDLIEKRIEHQNPCLSCATKLELTAIDTLVPFVVEPLKLKPMKKKKIPIVPTKLRIEGDNKICYPGVKMYHKNKNISRICSKVNCNSQTLLLDTSSSPQLSTRDIIVLPLRRNTGYRLCKKNSITSTDPCECKSKDS